MQLNGLIYTFPKELKLLIAAFVIVLSVGFYTGLLFVNQSSGVNSQGIEEQYLGNETDEDAAVMKFKKGKREMLTIIHTHILSMSFIFFLLGLILLTTKLNKKLNAFRNINDSNIYGIFYNHIKTSVFKENSCSLILIKSFKRSIFACN